MAEGELLGPGPGESGHLCNLLATSALIDCSLVRFQQRVRKDCPGLLRPALTPVAVGALWRVGSVVKSTAALPEDLI